MWRNGCLGLAIVAACFNCAPVDDGAGEEEARVRPSIHTALGAPADDSAQDELPISRPQYVESYNRFRGTPNWVAWHLTASDVGSATRQNDFRADASLPAGVYRVRPSDYDNSGYDRGHMCDSDDRTATVADNQATFLMSNMVPQRHALNAGPWEALEAYCRQLATQGHDLFIVAGPTYSAACRSDESAHGNLPSANCPTIGADQTAADRVAVPDATWKVVVVVDRGQGASAVTAQTRVIAVEMPNEGSGPARDWTPYITTVGQIEQHAGYRLLSALPASVRAALEQQTPSAAHVAEQQAFARALEARELAPPAPSMDRESDPCGGYADCAACTGDARCGWCGDDAGRCASGSADGPAAGACTSWAWSSAQCGP